MDVEDWDQDFEGGLSNFAGGASIGTAYTSISSRLSVQSESVAGADEDWNLVIDSSDESKAIQSAQQAGIPLPNNIPTSALLGGTIKRLGKQKSRPRLNDDWDNDLEMPDSAPLQLKPRTIEPSPATPGEEQDDFDELEGSLGIRFAGTKRDTRKRSSSASAMSPSLGSVTAESEQDDLGGLELPEGPMDFEAILKKRRAADAELSDLSQPSPAVEQEATMNVHKKSKHAAEENDDYVNDFDLPSGNVLEARQRTMNKNIQVKSARPVIPAPRPATTVNFHDKPTDKPVHTRSHIPRPVSGSRPATSRLEPLLESGASNIIPGRRQPTTTGSQLLRSKRSMPSLRSQQAVPAMQKPTGSFIPGAPSNNQNQPPTAHRAMPYHLRRDSDPRRSGTRSPEPRPHSRLSNILAPDTPSRGSRQRHDLAPASLAREAATKRTVTKPARRRNYGDGNELEIFDDLPTSTAKESKFVKQPVARGPPKPTLRQTHSKVDLREPLKRNIAVPDRNLITPAPPRTPASPTKGFYGAPTNTPSYLRDTAASRIARETRVGPNNPRPRSEGPLMPLSTNWKAQVAARSPHTSPSAQRQKTTKKTQPQLIKGIGAHVAKTEKGMVYNPLTLRWEGNENTLQHFDMPPPLETPTPTGREATSYMDRQHGPSSSPPRPALIAPMSTANGVQVNGGMVFDPRQMKWLKLKEGRDASGPISPSVTEGDEDDAFAGIEDLKDESSPAPMGVTGLASPVSLAAAPGAGEIREEFDLGPKFIETQQGEEAAWRRRCGAWFEDGEPRVDDGRWRWAIRGLAAVEGMDYM
ncbi:hypothetical protein LTR37_012679 [Vermiconidia calcicola]|uniref:Uncharacterized protein n=1 Tax=Vermiconidia calcicola TaxID=1690605 RepID=A0ACC3MYD9_9PEZI|nr:hypothetical protein LTR37_012679 [Vermiconidia calcicola]